jgi:hypothetical protein
MPGSHNCPPFLAAQVAFPARIPLSWCRRVFYFEASSFLLSCVTGIASAWLLFARRPDLVPPGQTLAVVVQHALAHCILSITAAAFLGLPCLGIAARTSGGSRPAVAHQDRTYTECPLADLAAERALLLEGRFKTVDSSMPQRCSSSPQRSRMH